MGTARSNLLNQLKGSFGNVILYEVNGQLRIRSKTGRYRKSKSSKQKAQKNRFKGAASFYHKLEMPMYMTWRKQPRLMDRLTGSVIQESI